ncbi:MAG: phosphoglycerate kinase, partial [Polyangiaceae bacterium]|nr:phosphoglycerate kinase [Polyangiaceae bacterium]
GAMANTFLAAQGKKLGRSRVEEDKLALARTLLQKAADRSVEVLLPVDLRAGVSLEDTTATIYPVDAFPENEMALDIGPETAEKYASRLKHASTVLWNGPMGLFENPAFGEGTLAVAHAMAECPGFTVVGGGDSVAAVEQAGLSHRYRHVSTGGGASLEYLEGRKLPGVEALR